MLCAASVTLTEIVSNTLAAATLTVTSEEATPTEELTVEATEERAAVS